MNEKLKPLPLDGEIVCKFEWWTIRKFDGHTLWMEKDGGEGTQISKQEFMAVMNGLWERNF